jgi:hypothetical protein
MNSQDLHILSASIAIVIERGFVPVIEFISCVYTCKQLMAKLTSQYTVEMLYDVLIKRDIHICNRLRMAYPNSYLGELGKLVLFILKFRDCQNNRSLLTRLLENNFNPYLKVNSHTGATYTYKIIIAAIVANDIPMAEFVCRISGLSYSMELVKMGDYIWNAGTVGNNKICRCDDSELCYSRYVRKMLECTHEKSSSHLGKPKKTDKDRSELGATEGRHKEMSHYRVSFVGLAIIMCRDEITKILVDHHLKTAHSRACHSNPDDCLVTLYVDGGGMEEIHTHS